MVRSWIETIKLKIKRNPCKNIAKQTLDEKRITNDNNR